MKTLVLGGVRSGKSRYAETLARAHGGPVTVIATATADDEEMRARIAAHRAQRPAEWTVVEEPIRLGDALRAAASPGGIVIIECLTLWLTNLLLSPRSAEHTSELQSQSHLVCRLLLAKTSLPAFLRQSGA